MQRHAPLVCAVLAAGCHGSHEPSPVTGTFRSTFITEQGERSLNASPDDFELSVLVPRASGDWPEIAARLSKDGAFESDPVPSGAYYLRIHAPDGARWSHFLSVGTRTIEMDTPFLGRPEAVVPRQATPLTIQATELQPWGFGNELHFFSLGAGAFDDDLVGLSTGEMPENTAQLSMTVDSALFRQPRLVDGRAGDRVFMTELTRQSQNRVSYLTPIRVFRSDGFVQQEGVSSTLVGAFEPITTSTNQRVNWKLGSFTKVETAVNPMATTQIEVLFFIADPAGPDRMTGGYPPEVLVTGVDATRTMPLTFPFTAEYRNPYPRAWALKYVTYSQYQVPWLPERLWPTIGSHGPLDEREELQVAALLGPPSHLQVNGRDASAALSGTGLTPALHWQVPSLGKATLYEAVIYQRDEGGELQLAGVIVTDRGDIAIPPGVLREAAPYVVLVTAYSNRSPGKPFHHGGAGAHGTAVTGLLTP